MKRLACHFLLCCGIAGMAAAGLCGESDTNLNAAAGLGAAPPSIDLAEATATNTSRMALADNNAAPIPKSEVGGAAAPPYRAVADTNAATAPELETGGAGAPPYRPPTDTNVLSAAVIDRRYSNSSPVAGSIEPAPKTEFELALDVARKQREEKSLVVATHTLEDLLKTNAPAAIQRGALFELALVMQDEEQSARAQQIWAQYLHLYADDPTVPDVLLRQGQLYRKMGVDEFAISKFYAVMSSALKLKQDNLSYYKKVVVQAQTEIADTYYLDAKYEQAADFFNRIIKSGDAEENREPLECKRIRALSYLTNHAETISAAQEFLTRYPKSADVPEVRFLLAGALKNTGRNAEALEQVLQLLQSEQENVTKAPETWAYWQRRAGNEIANQLYKQGDYADALQVYLSLADLDASAGWQAPVWYQAGMAYEQLQQWQKAAEMYTRILDRQKELTAANTTPALASLLEMARWRKDYIGWIQKAKLSDLAVHPMEITNSPGMAPH